MPIILNKQKIIAQTQTYKFESVTIAVNSGSVGFSPSPRTVSAYVRFGIYDENNKRINEANISYTGADYTKFWNDFNSGKFLYDELNIKNNLGLVVPVSVEDEFLNK